MGEKNSSEWMPSYPSCVKYCWRKLFLSNTTQSTKLGSPQLGLAGISGKRQRRLSKGTKKYFFLLTKLRISARSLPTNFYENLPKDHTTGPVGNTNAPNTKNTLSLTLQLAHCACSWVLHKSKSTKQNAIQKTNQNLWAREKPHKWVIVPPSGK